MPLVEDVLRVSLERPVEVVPVEAGPLEEAVVESELVVPVVLFLAWPIRSWAFAEYWLIVLLATSPARPVCCAARSLT